MVEVYNQVLQLNLYGFGAVSVNRNYAATAFELSGRMWQVVKGNGLKNKGKNIWVYDSDHRVFAGVELEEPIAVQHGLELLEIHLDHYAYFKHMGPYQQISQSGQQMREYLRNNGYEVQFPYIEIYGHWTSDESKLETELLMNLSSIK